MQPRVLIGLGAVALGLAGYAIAVMPGPGPAPVRPAAGAAQSPIAGERSVRDDPERSVADALQRVLLPPPEPDLKLPPVAARRAAEESFESMMQTLESLADAGKRVPRARREQLYRNTNDAFAAFSATLDAENSAEDRQALEDANIRMKAMLGELGVRVPKRPPQQPE